MLIWTPSTAWFLKDHHTVFHAPQVSLCKAIGTTKVTQVMPHVAGPGYRSCVNPWFEPPEQFTAGSGPKPMESKKIFIIAIYR